MWLQRARLHAGEPPSSQDQGQNLEYDEKQQRSHRSRHTALTNSIDAVVYMQRLENHRPPHHPFLAQPLLPWQAGVPPAQPLRDTPAGITGETSCLRQRGLCPPTVIANVQFGIVSPLLWPRAARHLEATNATSGTHCHLSASLWALHPPSKPRGEGPHPLTRQGSRSPRAAAMPRSPLGGVGAVEAGIKFSKESGSACLEAGQPPWGACNLTRSLGVRVGVRA